jgi:hypothetical protein
MLREIFHIGEPQRRLVRAFNYAVIADEAHKWSPEMSVRKNPTASSIRSDWSAISGLVRRQRAAAQREIPLGALFGGAY